MSQERSPHRTGDQFNPTDFLGTWRIIVGDIGHQDSDSEPYFAEITQEKADDGKFKLFSFKGSGKPRYRQTLEFKERTRTLESTENGVHRAISFWDGEPDSRADRIFAMRTVLVSVGPEQELLCEWESASDTDGTWGGEDG